MISEARDKWANTLDSEPLLDHWVLKPPYGYMVGVLIWPVFFTVLSVWGTLLQSDPPSVVVTVGGLAVGVGCFVVTSMGSALVLGVTAWNIPQEHIRQQFVLLVLSLLFAALLFGLYLNWSMIPYRYELGLSAFMAHELSKIVLLGPAIGFAFMISPVVVLAHRTHLR